MSAVIAFLATMAVGYAALNVVLWYALFRLSFGSRWNWRVLTGPWLYVPWADRHHVGGWS